MERDANVGQVSHGSEVVHRFKPLLISTFDRDGGAARAVLRLHQGLQGLQINSQLLVQYKTISDRTVLGAKNKPQEWLNRGRPTLDNLPLVRYRGRGGGNFALQWFPETVAARVEGLAPDIVNFHWICGFVRIETLAKLKRPIVLTLHDMWAFTGGCYYTQECDRYTQSCGACPQLHSQRDNDITRWVWQRKRKAWQGLNLTVVTPSRWLGECVRQSSLLRHSRLEVIANGIDISRYKPGDRRYGRSWLNLPPDKHLILFAANSLSYWRKGRKYLMAALQEFQKFTIALETELVILGSPPDEQYLNLGFPVHVQEHLHDDIAISLICATVDLVVVASTQDNLPNSILEALACGTPCVAFDIGGISDMIEHKYNGYLAPAFKTKELANGINWVLEDNQRHQVLSENARKTVVTKFTQEQQAQAYTQLFADILQSVGEK